MATVASRVVGVSLLIGMTAVIVGAGVTHFNSKAEPEKDTPRRVAHSKVDDLAAKPPLTGWDPGRETYQQYQRGDVTGIIMNTP